MSAIGRYCESCEPLRALRHGGGHGSLFSADTERIGRVLNVARTDYDP